MDGGDEGDGSWLLWIRDPFVPVSEYGASPGHFLREWG